VGRPRKTAPPTEIRGDVVTRVWNYAKTIYDTPSSVECHMARWFTSVTASTWDDADRRIPPVELVYDNDTVVGVRVR